MRLLFYITILKHLVSKVLIKSGRKIALNHSWTLIRFSGLTANLTLNWIIDLEHVSLIKSEILTIIWMLIPRSSMIHATNVPTSCPPRPTPPLFFSTTAFYHGNQIIFFFGWWLLSDFKLSFNYNNYDIFVSYVKILASWTFQRSP